MDLDLQTTLGIIALASVKSVNGLE